MVHLSVRITEKQERVIEEALVSGSWRDRSDFIRWLLDAYAWEEKEDINEFSTQNQRMPRQARHGEGES